MLLKTCSHQQSVSEFKLFASGPWGITLSGLGGAMGADTFILKYVECLTLQLHAHMTWVIMKLN